MEKQHLQETVMLANEASLGNWFPAALVGTLLSLIILLLLSIYKRDKKSNEKRHQDNEKIIKDLAENHKELSKVATTQGLILAELKGNFEAKK